MVSTNYIEANGYSSNLTPPSPLCNAATCTQAQQAIFDLYTWKQYLVSLNINSLKGTVCLDSSNGIPTQYSPNCNGLGSKIFVKLTWLNNLSSTESSTIKNYLILPVYSTLNLALFKNTSSSGGGSGTKTYTSNVIMGDCTGTMDCSNKVIFGNCSGTANCSGAIIQGVCSASANCSNSVGNSCSSSNTSVNCKNFNSLTAADLWNASNLPFQSSTCTASTCSSTIVGGNCTTNCSTSIVYGDCTSSSSSCYNSVVFGDCSSTGSNGCQNTFVMGNCSGSSCYQSYIIGNCSGTTCQGSYIVGNCTGNCYGATVLGNCSGTSGSGCQSAKVTGTCTGTGCSYLGSGSSINYPSDVSGIVNTFSNNQPISLATQYTNQNIYTYPTSPTTINCTGNCSGSEYLNCNGSSATCTGSPSKIDNNCTNGAICSSNNLNKPVVVFGDCNTTGSCQSSLIFGSCYGGGSCYGSIVGGNCSGSNCGGVKRIYNIDAWNPTTHSFGP